MFNRNNNSNPGERVVFETSPRFLANLKSTILKFIILLADILLFQDNNSSSNIFTGICCSDGAVTGDSGHILYFTTDYCSSDFIHDFRYCFLETERSISSPISG